jgi:hypothetical protein
VTSLTRSSWWKRAATVEAFTFDPGPCCNRRETGKGVSMGERIMRWIGTIIASIGIVAIIAFTLLQILLPFVVVYVIIHFVMKYW